MFNRKSVLNSVIRRKFAVTLAENEGSFGGILTEFDAETLVFECCKSLPSKPDEAIRDIPGRVFVDRINVAYIQEVNA
jgi:hypothetical protein